MAKLYISIFILFFSYNNTLQLVGQNDRLPQTDNESLEEFRSNGSEKTAQFHVMAYWSVGAIGNYNYDGSHYYIVVKDTLGYKMMCYVDKTLPVGKKIYSILKDEKEHKMFLEIKRDSPERKDYIITNILDDE